jgi:hypothetical protein
MSWMPDYVIDQVLQSKYQARGTPTRTVQRWCAGDSAEVVKWVRHQVIGRCDSTQSATAPSQADATQRGVPSVPATRLAQLRGFALDFPEIKKLLPYESVRGLWIATENRL